MLIEIIKFILYSLAIVIISKYILSETIRRLAKSLMLDHKIVGNIAGISTSIPELLMVVISSLNGLIISSIYNILSSNIINLMQYLITIKLNKNIKNLKNTAIKSDIVIVLATIIIPAIIIKLKINMELSIIPLFIFLFIFFLFLNYNIHKVYLNTNENKEEKNSEKGINLKKRKFLNILKYSTILILTGTFLFFISYRLGDVLESLCKRFGISEIIIGILLGVITSIPELITFSEAQNYNKKELNNMEGVVEATNNLLTSNLLNLCIIQTIGIFLSNIT